MSAGSSGAGSAPVMLNPSEFPKPLGYNPFPNTLQPYIAAVLFETFLYGIYFVLFTVCLYILIRRRRGIHWILPVLASIMFSIATADIGYTMHLLFRRLLKGSLTFRDTRPKYLLYVTNNILADCTFLYRCYVVWGGDLRIMVLPILLLVASMVSGYLFEGSTSALFAYSWVYVLLTFILNLILTGLTAGRIWWLSSKGHKLLDRTSRKRYHIALAAILESGLLTALYMIPDLILVSIVLDNGFVQVVGIVPTLIVVQVGLGRAINLGEESSEETLGPIEVAEPSTPRHESMNHVISFDPNTQIAAVRDDPSRFISLGSVFTYQDRLRTDEDIMAMEMITLDVEDRREKSPQRDSAPDESESELARDPEKGSGIRDQNPPLYQPSDLIPQSSST